MSKYQSSIHKEEGVSCELNSSLPNLESKLIKSFDQQFTPLLRPTYANETDYSQMSHGLEHRCRLLDLS